MSFMPQQTATLHPCPELRQKPNHSTETMKTWETTVLTAAYEAKRSPAEMGARTTVSRYPVPLQVVWEQMKRILPPQRAALLTDSAYSVANLVLVYLPTVEEFAECTRRTSATTLAELGAEVAQVRAANERGVETLNANVVVVDPISALGIELHVRAEVYVAHKNIFSGGPVNGYWQPAADWYVRSQSVLGGDDDDAGSMTSTGSATEFSDAEMAYLPMLQAICKALGYGNN